MTTDKHVIDVLQGYTDESPWLSAVLKDNCTLSIAQKRIPVMPNKMR